MRLGRSGVAEVAHGAFPGAKEARCLVVFELYIDASRHPEGKTNIDTVAVTVADEDRWRGFEEEWNPILAKYQVPRFHAAQFESRKRGTPYYGWSEDLRDRLKTGQS